MHKHEIEYWPLDRLRAYERNSRIHSPDQVAELAASMREFGFTIPILAAENGTIIAGHGRLMAARKVGLAEVPVIVARGWSDAQIRAYCIADNRLAERASWDMELLKLELGELADGGFDLGTIGFSEADFAEIMEGTDTEGMASEAPGREANGALAERFGVPPFSVLNAREGWWQERKAAWIALGIRSELGRGLGSAPGGNPLPAADYSKSKARGHGNGKAMSDGKKTARGAGRDAERRL
jgi:hypothetical protein